MKLSWVWGGGLGLRSSSWHNSISAGEGWCLDRKMKRSHASSCPFLPGVGDKVCTESFLAFAFVNTGNQLLGSRASV